MAKEIIRIITAAVNTIVQHMAAMAIIIINGSSNMVQQLIAVAMDNGMRMPADTEIVVGTIDKKNTNKTNKYCRKSNTNNYKYTLHHFNVEMIFNTIS